MANSTNRLLNVVAPHTWFKVLICLALCSWCYLLGRILFIPHQSYFGLSANVLVIILGGMSFVFALFLVVIWRFPHSRLVTMFFWLLSAARESIAVLALLGLLYYIVKLPLLSFKGGGIQPNITLYLSNSGVIVFLNIVLVVLVALSAEPVDRRKPPFKLLEQLLNHAETITKRLSFISGWWVGILPALLPVITSSVVIYLFFGATLSDYLPVNWNDATGYWLWIRSFSHYGFNVGYNVPNEMIAPAAFNHYGEGSPLYVFIYGAIGQLVGWSPQLPILINFTILAIAIYGFIWILKLDALQSMLVTAVMLTFWPVSIYILTTSHETLNQAIGILLAGIFYFLLSNKVENPFVKVGFAGLVFAAALVRMSWALLFFPLIFLSIPGSFFRKSILSITLGGILTFGVVTLTNYLVPPAQNSIFSVLRQASVSGMGAVADYFLTQLRRLLSPVDISAHLAVGFEMGIILAWSLWRLRKPIRAKTPLATILQTRTAFDIYNVVSLLVAGMSLYLVEGFSRTFIPPLLVVVLIQVAQKDYKLVTNLILLNLIFASTFLSYLGMPGAEIESLRGNYTYDRTQNSPIQTEIEKYMVFDTQTENQWCNTIFIPLNYYDARLTLLPPGIGVSYLFEDLPKDSRLKSNYLLLDENTYNLLTEIGNIHTKLIASLPIGVLYHNLDSGCEIKSR